MATAPTDFKQANSIPTTKVISGGIAGAVSAIIVWILNAFNVLPDGVQIPGEIASALTTVVSFAVSYFVPPSQRDSIVPGQ
jgi:Mg/Co/Ni transporter MgtE